jgi:Tfp pilus assembly protein FimV
VAPAILYLVLVTGSTMVWLAGDLAWTIGISAMHRSTRSAFSAARVVSIAIAVMLVMASWKVSPARAEVVPPAHRVMASQEEPIVRATSALTFVAMVEAVERPSSEYTVRSGDCLWKIARKAIVSDGDKPTGATIAVLWRRIYDINSDVIGANPRLIFPGQVLVIPER